MTEFISRKNKVMLTDKGTVCKSFSSLSACDKEVEALYKLNGVFAPLLLSKKDGAIELEYIEGELLIDRYFKASPEEAVTLAKALANTVLDIYKALEMITFDENFRNYIVNKNGIFRVDFEEATSGSLEQWCAKLLAFASLYDVPQDTKFAFISSLINNLSLQKKLLNEEYIKELNFLADRWGAACPIPYRIL